MTYISWGSAHKDSWSEHLEVVVFYFVYPNGAQENQCQENLHSLFWFVAINTMTSCYQLQLILYRWRGDINTSPVTEVVLRAQNELPALSEWILVKKGNVIQFSRSVTSGCLGCSVPMAMTMPILLQCGLKELIGRPCKYPICISLSGQSRYACVLIDTLMKVR